MEILATAASAPAPLVSVIVAAFNCALYIDAAVRSVVEQTYRHFELIVVDDGSTDDTRARAECWAAGDSRVRVISQVNSGTAAGARNTGLTLASGEYVCFLDGDDYYHPQRLAVLVGFLHEQPDLGLAFHDFELVDAGGAPIGGTYLGDCNYLDKAAAAAAFTTLRPGVMRSTRHFYPFMTSAITGIWTGSVMIRRGLLVAEADMFVTTQRVGEDIDLWFRLAARADVGLVDQVLSFYRQHSQSVMRDIEASSAGFIFAHSRNFERARARLTPTQTTRCRQRLATELRNLAYHQELRGQTRQALATYRRSLSYVFAMRTLLAAAKAVLRPWLRKPGQANS